MKCPKCGSEQTRVDYNILCSVCDTAQYGVTKAKSKTLEYVLRETWCEAINRAEKAEAELARVVEAERERILKLCNTLIENAAKDCGYEDSNMVYMRNQIQALCEKAVKGGVK
jgi:uncharacterized Zn finger protein (UPF0148 family)